MTAARSPSPSSTPSTRRLEALPEPTRLCELMRALALLDAAMEPDWEYRYYSFAPAWRPGEALGSMRNGQGDWFFAWFPAPGAAVIRGFDHESSMSPFRRPDEQPWPGIYDGLPPALDEARALPGSPPEEVTFCVWNAGGGWERGAIEFPPGNGDPDGSMHLLALLDDDPSSYVRFASDYYEREPDASAVRAIYRGEPLTEALILSINPDARPAAVLREARALGYPMAASSKTKAQTKSKSKSAADPAAKSTAKPKPQTKSTAAGQSPAGGGGGGGKATRRNWVPKPKETRGKASFSVEVHGTTVRLVAGAKTVAEAVTDDLNFYSELFDLVKARINALKG